MDRDILLEIKDVTAGYNGVDVLTNVNLKIYSNDFIGVIGPNGGGKTTLVKVMLGLIKPRRGKVTTSLSTLQKSHSIGYLPQVNLTDYKFPISVSKVVLSGVMQPEKPWKRFSKEDCEKAEKVMQQMGIIHLREKSIGELSGGQKQRVFLARSIISSPALLLLDEPNTFVDNRFEGELYENLVELNSRMAIVVVSHDVGMISAYVKTIACVNKELHYHPSNIISEEQLLQYNCPIQLITHGEIPHTVLGKHKH